MSAALRNALSLVLVLISAPICTFAQAPVPPQRLELKPMGSSDMPASSLELKPLSDLGQSKNVFPPPGELWINPKMPAPDWLKSKEGSIEANEKIYAALRTRLEPEYNGIPLQTLLTSLADDLNIPIWINTPELDLLGIDPDTPISIRLPNISARSMLRLVLDPLETTYIVRNEVLEITSKDSAESDPTIAYYDMAWAIDKSDYAGALVSAIENTIDPDSWISNGGTSNISTVGSVLIVAAPDPTQQKIRAMFASLRRFKSKNVYSGQPIGDVIQPPTVPDGQLRKLEPKKK